MLKNYLKIALKVLKRNRFYTFVSLFGISFTLMVLMLSTAFIDNELGANRPLSNKDRILVVSGMGMKKWQRETNTTIDTIYRNDSTILDTTIIETPIVGNSQSSSSSQLGYDFCKEHILPMQSPEMISLFVPQRQIEVYPNNARLELSTCMVDANYWKIFDFDFVEGQPFGESSIENQSHHTVLTEEAAGKYFGAQDSYLNRELVWGHDVYKIVGIIKEPNTSSFVVQGDAFMPVTNLPDHALNYGYGYFGGCNVALLAKDGASGESMTAELKQIENNTEMKDGFDILYLWEKDITDLYAWPIIGSQDTRSGNKFLMILFGVLILFLIIPTFNLINLNITRILERSSEIGVRKAFGARTDHLLIQFLFENIVLTFLGGLLGLVFTFFAMRWFNKAQILEGTHLEFNSTVFGISLLITLFFGICSGLFPAWKMAGKEIAVAIKNSRI
ncbi:ABC transporter permease [Membranihabitans maritimus]|uniref:ABC transporter permease n=1 Tax=Membranihabitans maritimus TaxID=2904244 RepID=UPI001F335519|nr:ABC transporter permease [Membranihabitans maritimus]